MRRDLLRLSWLGRLLIFFNDSECPGRRVTRRERLGQDFVQFSLRSPAFLYRAERRRLWYALSHRARPCFVVRDLLVPIFLGVRRCRRVLLATGRAASRFTR